MIYTVMFKGYISNKIPEKVFDLLDEMIIQPDAITVTLIFNACAHVNNDRAKTIGKKLLDRMSNVFRNDIILLNSAVYMLMKFGDVTRAEHLFNFLSNKKDTVSYNVMTKGILVSEYFEF
jgi:pentatricopeptide repeat protein